LKGHYRHENIWIILVATLFQNGGLNPALAAGNNTFKPSNPPEMKPLTGHDSRHTARPSGSSTASIWVTILKCRRTKAGGGRFSGRICTDEA